MSLPTVIPHHDSLAVLEGFDGPPLWLGDGQILEAPGCFWGAAAIELHSAPSADPTHDQTGLIATQRQLAERVVRGLRGWENRGGLELRYVWGQHSGRDRLRLLLIARAVGRTLDSARAWAGQMLHNTVDLFPPTYDFGPLVEDLPHDIDGWVEIERTEESRQPGPFVPPGSVGYYYLIHPMGGSGAGWPSLARALAANGKPGFLSIALVPTTLTDLERRAIDHVCSLATYLSQPQQTYDFFGNPRVDPPDVGAQAVVQAWERFPERSGLLARIGLAAPKQDLQRLASLIGSTLTEGSDNVGNALPNKFKIVGDLGYFDAWQTATLGLPFPRNQHAVWSLPASEAPITLERMPYFFSEHEAGGLFVLPVPDAQGVPGIPLARRSAEHRETVTDEPVSDGVCLGPALHNGRPAGPIVLPLKAINRHTLIVGASGSGKTTTVLTLLTQLWRDHEIPFLVIEPAKTEYRTLFDVPGLEQLQVITLGNEGLAPLRLNPLEPPPGVRCEKHQSAVMAALKLALPLFPPQPELLARALPETYYRAGWDDETTIADGIAAPTLRDLLKTYQTIFEKAGYEGEARNIGRGFRVRLESLLFGSRGRMLDTMRSSDFGQLLARPTIIEMEDIDDADDKAVLAAFLLDRVRAAARRRGSSGGSLRHVTVIEEAHRLLSKTQAGSTDSASGMQARAASVQAFCEAIAELRAMGEGFVLSSQSPAELAKTAVDNTGTRIVHRMESSDDRRVMLDDFGADEAMTSIAARLQAGEAIVRWPQRDEVELARVELSDPMIDSSRTVDDENVGDRMRDYRRQTTHMLPYALCTGEICQMGCRANVRRTGSRLAEDAGPAAEAIWKDGAKDPVRRIAKLVSSLQQHVDEQQTYCGLVHIAVNGSALHPAPGVDTQTPLISAVRRVTQGG